jgi:hypothetical protein
MPALPLLSREYRDRIWIPALLVVVGVAIIDRRFIVHAVGAVSAFAGYKLWLIRE